MGTSYAFGIAQAGMTAYQSFYSANQASLEARVAADSLDAQAARKDLEAEEAEHLGLLEQDEQIRKGRLERAEQKVGYAASGVKVNEGSAVEVLADKAAWSEYERQKIEYKSGLESWGLKYDAALLRQEAVNTRATASVSRIGVAQAIAGGGKQLYAALGS